MLRQAFYLLASFLLIGTAIFLVYRVTLTPQTSRSWLPEQERTATADIGDTITLHNVRDWTYSDTAPLSTEWIEMTVDPSTITRTWFYLEPFSDWEAVGHTFLSFEFEDGTALAFSVEARRESHETYSAVRGLANEYELSYQWGTERDFVARRLVYLNHPLRMYPLELSQEDSAALFRTLARETNTLAKTPRFYNTLAANCTNVLASIVNTHYPGRLMYDLSWYLTGYSDGYLMKEGLIKIEGTASETKTLHDLTPFRTEVKEKATADAVAFSTFLRTLLP